MASFLNTDLGDLYSQWGERVAFNEGYQRQKIAEARTAGQDAFSLGLDRVSGRDAYIEAKNSRFSEAAEFEKNVDDLGVVEDMGEVEDLGAVDDLGETDAVALRESFDPNDYAAVFGCEAYAANIDDALEMEIDRYLGPAEDLSN